MTKWTLIKAAMMLALCTTAVHGASAQDRGPQPVIVHEVRIDRFVDRVEALGTLRANETVELTATVTERVTAVNFNDGQRVEKGDILVEMTSLEQRALLDEARSTLREAQEQYDRIAPLATSGFASTALLDERRRQVDTARARLSAIQAQLNERIVVAPFSGVVGLRNISVGALVQPGTSITRIHDDSVMKLDFSVPATFLGTVREGLNVVAKSAALGGRVFEGRVSSIDNEIDPVTRSFVVRALIENKERVLKPGLLMTVELLKDPRDAIVVPEEAIIPEGRTRTIVFVVNRDGNALTGTAERRTVIVGARRPGEVEILEGLTPGELVVTHGGMRVRPGQNVTIKAIEHEDAPIADLLDQRSGD